MASTRRRNDPVEPGDRRHAPPRRLAGRHRHRARRDARVVSCGRCGRRERSSRRRSSSTGSSYFGSHDGRVFAVRSDTGRVRLGLPDGWTHQREPVGRRRLGLRHDYAGAFVCLDRRTGARALDDVPQARSRSATRASTRARRPTDRALYSVARSGKVVAARRLGRTRRVDGGRRRARLHDTCGRGRHASSRAGSTAGCARSGRRRATSSGARGSDGRILGAPVVIGPYVFFSTLEKRTYALRVEDGTIAWRLPLGQLLAGHRDRADVLLLAERPPDRRSRPRRPGRDALRDAGGVAARAASAGAPTPSRSTRRAGRRTRRRVAAARRVERVAT